MRPQWVVCDLRRTTQYTRCFKIRITNLCRKSKNKRKINSDVCRYRYFFLFYLSQILQTFTAFKLLRRQRSIISLFYKFEKIILHWRIITKLKKFQRASSKIGKTQLVYDFLIAHLCLNLTYFGHPVFNNKFNNKQILVIIISCSK